MAHSDLNPRDQHDIEVLRAQGVLAELLVVDVDNADQGLRAYAEASGTSLHEVARRVCDRELLIDRELCVAARDHAERLDLLERSRNAIEQTRKNYLRLADAAEALAATYERIADARETHAPAGGPMEPGEEVRVTRRRADAERQAAEKLRRAAEVPEDHDEGRGTR